jgi:hypothetical protein
MAEEKSSSSNRIKTATTSVKDFLSTPKDYLARVLEDGFGRLEVKLNTREIYVLSKEMFELFVRLEVRKEKIVFEEKYRALKEKFTRVKDDEKVEKLSKAQQTLVQLANKFNIFENMSTGELLAVVENTQFLKLEKGEKVFSINNTSKEAFFIIQGGVSIIIDDLEVAFLKKNEFFGEMAYITKNPRNATAVIKSNGAILLSIKIKEEIDDTQSEAFMKLFININAMLIDKIEEMNKKLYSR